MANGEIDNYQEFVPFVTTFSKVACFLGGKRRYVNKKWLMVLTHNNIYKTPGYNLMYQISSDMFHITGVPQSKDRRSWVTTHMVFVEIVNKDMSAYQCHLILIYLVCQMLLNQFGQRS